MAGKLSFSIAINLLTENFKKGTNTVKGALASMQAKFLTFAAALGVGGIGLGNLVSRLIGVARETGRVTTALRNVSGSLTQFADSQRFLVDMAKKYGLEINALTGNFAKFTASASAAGMSMSGQKKIFESVSRACTAFGMSADDSNGVFLALSQMMSKGKISSEELRLQMGERLPIALQAMAKAADVPISELDKLLKQGKLMSSDILPKFAEALNGMIPKVDTDNLETSLNRLKNTFQGFTDNMGIQDGYKKLIDGLAGLVDFAKNSVTGLVTFAGSMLTGKLLSDTIKYFKGQYGLLDNSVTKHERAEIQKKAATKRRVDAEKIFIATQKDYETVINGQRLASEAQLQKATLALEKSKLIERKADIAAIVAEEEAAAIKSMGFWRKTGSVVAGSFKKLGASLKAMWAAAWPMALITVISTLIAKLVETYQETRRVRNMFSDYQKEVENAGGSDPGIVKMKSLLRIMNDRAKNQKEINTAQTELQTMLGVENKSQKELNDLVEKRIGLLKATATAELYARKIAESEDEINTLYSKHGGESALNFQYQVDFSRYKNSTFWGGKLPESMIDFDKIVQLKKIIADSNLKLDRSLLETANTKTDTSPIPDPDEKKTPLRREEEKYAEAIRELTNKLNNRSISEEEYNKQLNDLNKTTYDTLSGMLTPEEAKKSETYQTAKNGFSVSDEFSEEQKRYDEGLKEYANQLKNGTLTEKGYQEAKLSLLESTIKAIAGMDNLTETERKYLDGLLSDAKGTRSDLVERPELKTRDKTFDYKKSKTETMSDDLNIAKENLDRIKDAYDKGANELAGELNNALTNVKSLEDALRIAEVKEDIKDLTKQLNKGAYSAVKDIASGADRIASAFSSMSDVMGDDDATAWERIMAVWDAMFSTVDAFIGIIENIGKLTEITEKLGLAKQVEAGIEKGVADEKIVNTAKGIVADQTGAAIKKETAMSNVKASTAEGVANAGKSASGLPWPWNMIAIAAAIASAIAAFASIPKFANGGILQGSSTGDKNLARFNGGEMFLNGRQQATLFQLANGKGIKANAGSGHVEFEIRYDKLIGVLQNGDKKRRRGR